MVESQGADDCHVKAGKTLYSVPWRYIGTEVDVRAARQTVTFYMEGALIKTHAVKV